MVKVSSLQWYSGCSCRRAMDGLFAHWSGQGQEYDARFKTDASSVIATRENGGLHGKYLEDSIVQRSGYILAIAFGATGFAALTT